MTADEIKALIAAAAPGAKIVVVTVELPPAPAAAEPVPKPWIPLLGVSAQAPAIAERRDPFTCGELAHVLRVQPDTVSLWCRQGVLRGATKAGGAGWRIPPTAVLAMLGGAAAGGDVDAAAVGGEQGERPVGTGPGPGAATVDSNGTTAGHGRGVGGQVPANGAPGGIAGPGGWTGAGGEAHQETHADVDATFDVTSFGSWRARRAGGIP